MASRVRRLVDESLAFFKVDRPDRTSDDRQRSGLKRQESLRASFKRRLLALPPAKRAEAIKAKFWRRKRPISKESKGHKAELAKYRRLAARFLGLPENAWCEICTVRREAGENILRNYATEVHHYAGRIGRLLCYVPYFKASCYGCRAWPHSHPKKARELRLLAPTNQYNVYPE